MTITTDQTLGELLTQDPRRARVMETYGLDYCCGGNRSLASACQEAGIDAGDVAQALDLPDRPPAPEWLQLGPAALAQHIVATHHAYLWEEMPRLDALVTKVHGVHGERHPELSDVAALYREVVADLGPHLTKEERILFPAIAALEEQGAAARFPFGRLANPIAAMLAEHDTVGALFAQIREATGGYVVPGDGCASYTAMLTGLEEMERDTHEHIHKENNVLFPRVLELENELFGPA
ncbi:MAG: iron-sulfur cluster repair di-iron protein [Austwickia sp.]|nr:iron-sulfur cluster repair di-iron protein [Austwickia sp.]